MTPRTGSCLGAIALGLLACGPAQTDGPTTTVSRIDAAPDTIASMASGEIGLIYDMVVLEDGRLFVSDALRNLVHVVAPDGGLVRSFGGAGSGPEEFQRPSTMRLFGDSLAIVDHVNGRLSLMSTEGEPLGFRPIPAGGAAPTLTADGGFILPLLGRDTVLAHVYSPDREVVAALGATIGEPWRRIDLGETMSQIQRGEVPSIMLNAAEAAIAEDGTTWFYLPAAGLLTKYEPDGREAWRMTVEDPAFGTVLADFVARNEALGGTQVWELRYILDANPVGDDVWLLLGQSVFGPAEILVISSDGVESGRMIFEHVFGAIRLQVDEARGVVYFGVEDGSELLRVRSDQTR